MLEYKGIIGLLWTNGDGPLGSGVVFYNYTWLNKTKNNIIFPIKYH